jgi:hypothetical protein
VAKLNADYAAALRQQGESILAEAKASVQASVEAARALAQPTGNLFFNKRLPVNPDTFNGDIKSDASAWLFEFDTYLAVAQLDPAMYVGIAAVLLRGAAATWWRSVVTKGTAPTTYADFKIELVKMFEVINPVKNARDRLVRLRQIGAVRTYTSAFRNVCLEIPDMNDSEMLDRYIRGLKDRVQQEVNVRNPSTLDEAARIAERYDSATYAVRSTGYNAPSSNRPTYAAAAATPKDLGAVQHVDNSKPSYTELTPELRIQLIKEGKCLYCRKHGHMALSCPNKPKYSSPN